MHTIKLQIAGDILAEYPDVVVGAFLARQLPRAEHRLGVQPADQAVKELEREGVSIETLAAEPRIRAWREAAANQGLKPSQFKSSPEQLARRFLRGSGISTPLPVVNAYCSVSAKHLTPLGGYDVEHIGESVQLRFARPSSDLFVPLGGSSSDMALTSRIAVYATGNTVMCWQFNHRDSRETCLRQETETGLFIGEAIDRAQHASLRSALSDLQGVLDRAGAEVTELTFVDSSCSGQELSSLAG